MSARYDKLCAAVLEQYGDSPSGMVPVLLPNSLNQDITVLRAWLGVAPDSLHLGMMRVIFAYANRVFRLEYHVWEPHQKPHMANRILELGEFDLEKWHGLDLLSIGSTDFGSRATWLYTPDSALDADSLVVRTVAKICKSFSVEHKLCRKFRACYPKDRAIRP